jgi:hypothetical protein
MTTASKAWRVLGLALLTAVTFAGTGAQVNFDSPDEAANALIGAVENGDYALFISIAGPQMAPYWSGGDAVRDRMERDRFLDDAHRNGVRLDGRTGDRTFIRVGDGESFPAPLVKTNSRWHFDGDAGSAELTTRRIRRNEAAALEQCQRFREAEFAYFAAGYGANPSFTQKIRSAPGQHDGLFWSEAGEEDESPVGPPFAAAAFAERKPGDGTRPLFGYYFKILVVQGPEAAGGPLDYRVNGRLRRGFALLAWPAEYAVDGVQSLLINHFGDIYEKDLGVDTGRLAETMTAFNPDRSWRKFDGNE